MSGGAVKWRERGGLDKIEVEMTGAIVWRANSEFAFGVLLVKGKMILRGGVVE